MNHIILTQIPAATRGTEAADGLRDAVRALLPGLRARAAEAERRRQVPEENVAALREAGLFRTVQPRLFGGHEQDFAVLAELIVEIAAACPSTGWACGLLAAHQWLVAAFPEAAQREVWQDDPDATACASYAPTGKALPVEGGFRLAGRWAFASGCDAASWAVCSALLPAGEGQPPVLSFLLVPRADFTLDDTWHTVGLAGTGSKTVVVQDAFVPAHRVLRVRDTATGDTPGRRLHDSSPLYAMPMLCNIPSCLAATAVGAAAGALHDYLGMTSQRVTRGAVAGGGNRMAEFPTIQLRVAEATASVDAARELLLRDLRRRAETARNGGAISVEDRIASRRGQAFATSLALRATEALNASTGGQGLDLANPVQRAWRDVNAVSRHVSLNWDAVGTMAGQQALGLEPKGQY